MVPVNRKRKSLDQEKEVEEKKPVLIFEIRGKFFNFTKKKFKYYIN